MERTIYVSSLIQRVCHPNYRSRRRRLGTFCPSRAGRRRARRVPRRFSSFFVVFPPFLEEVVQNKTFDSDYKERGLVFEIRGRFRAGSSDVASIDVVR